MMRQHMGNIKNTTDLMSRIASSANLQQAYAWLRQKRQKAHHNNLFWSFSHQWPTQQQQLRQTLLAGDYSLSPVQQISLNDGTVVSQWHPRDAIVLKAIAQIITPQLNQSLHLKQATHLKDNGGLKYAVRTAHQKMAAHPNGFVIKTDIADYYASIRHHVLHEMLFQAIKDKRVCRLLWQVMNRVHVSKGHHRLIQDKSIPRGCPLSPLFGAIYLSSLDSLMTKYRIPIVRYMDDFVIFTKTRHQCRRVLKALYRLLKPLGLTLAPDKTFIGRISKGFSFLGYRFTPNGLILAPQTIERMQQRYRRLYEQGASTERLASYVTHWVRWVLAGLGRFRDSLKVYVVATVDANGGVGRVSAGTARLCG